MTEITNFNKKVDRLKEEKDDLQKINNDLKRELGDKVKIIEKKPQEFTEKKYNMQLVEEQDFKKRCEVIRREITVNHVKKLNDFEIDYTVKSELMDKHKDNLDLKMQQENYNIEIET